MAGIYIHIPFCKKACNYCNFHFSVNKQLLPEMVASITTEARLQRNYITAPVETIYFGGGTPSLLSNEELNLLLQEIRSLFSITENVEITLEANPDDISEKKLAEWKEAGINRLSIGIQSFFEEDLLWMGRAHNAAQAIDCIKKAQTAGFSNLSVDLIYGGPTLSNEHWKENMNIAIGLNIPHLSCYALTVEPKTVLAQKITDRLLADVDPEIQATHFTMLMERTEAAGYEHYEISNFALPGKRSRHNSSYWKGKPYLGLGPAAHSFNGTCRQWNIANNSLYISSISKGMIPFEIEVLTRTQQVNEYMMTALRTAEGIDLNRLTEIGNELITETVLSGAQKFIAQGTINHTGHFLVIPGKGKFYADGIAADLFLI